MGEREQLRRRREALRLSQPKLAEMAGLSRNTVSNFELGKGTCDWRTVAAVRKALCVGKEETLDGEARPVEPQPWQCPACRTWMAPRVREHKCADGDDTEPVCTHGHHLEEG